jgi:hypothetical protein
MTAKEEPPLLHAICILLCPAWDMMEGENVKAFAPPFKLPLPRGSTPSPILHRGLCWRPESFDEFIRNQIQAFQLCLFVVVFNGRHAFATLRFGYFFIKKKVRALRWRRTEARLGEGEKLLIVILNEVKNP